MSFVSYCFWHSSSTTVISLEPIDQFQCGFLQNIAVKMVHTVSWEINNEFDQLQTAFA